MKRKKGICIILLVSIFLSLIQPSCGQAFENEDVMDGYIRISTDDNIKTYNAKQIDDSIYLSVQDLGEIINYDVTINSCIEFLGVIQILFFILF